MISILNYIVSLDIKIEPFILSWRSIFWDNFFFTITILGNWIAIVVIFVILALFFKKYNKSFLIKPFLVAILGSGIMTLLIKTVVGRARPIGNIPLYIEKLSSFPSAHAALVVALFGFLLYCLIRFRFNLFTKIISVLLCLLIILLVGFSRLYLGVHFASDVIAGYLVGLLWVLVAMHISRAGFNS
jgi:undecaprenyl-diphosphatase